ncbi:MAG TPA: hypothetical protein GX532_07760 [Clostridia bacterium]|nr:hypothetical protein [Clostridia bacterium]
MVYKLFFLLIAMIISFYTLTYMTWLWRQKKKRGALGVLFLALVSLFYAVFVLFFL